MDGRHLTGENEVFRVHQPGDGQPAFDAGRTGDARRTGGLEVTDKVVELDADPEVEGEKRELDGAADEL